MEQLKFLHTFAFTPNLSLKIWTPMYLQPYQKLQHTLKQQQQQQQQQQLLFLFLLLLHFNLHFAIAENLDLTNPFQFAFCNRE
jgi:hypothetical protein